MSVRIDIVSIQLAAFVILFAACASGDVLTSRDAELDPPS